MIKLERAKTLRPGTILFHIHQTNADGSPQRWVVNGQVKVWKRSPDRIRIPIKHGMWDYDYLTEDGLKLLFTDEEAAVCAREAARAASVAFSHMEEAMDGAALLEDDDAKRAALQAADAHEAAREAQDAAEAAEFADDARAAMAKAEAARDAAEEAANEIVLLAANAAARED